jgi:hypothetical protein
MNEEVNKVVNNARVGDECGRYEDQNQNSIKHFGYKTFVCVKVKIVKNMQQVLRQASLLICVLLDQYHTRHLYLVFIFWYLVPLQTLIFIDPNIL